MFNMNDPIWPIILGAALAIAGGWISDEIRAWRESGRELRAIKIAIGDELDMIETTIKNMNEVYEKAKVLSSTYITDLLSNTNACDQFRSRFFLIKDEKLRKKVVAFYKKLKDTAKQSEGKGTLADTVEAKAEQERIASAFKALGEEARGLRDELV